MKQILSCLIIIILIGCGKNAKVNKVFYPTGEIKEQKVYLANDTNSYDYCSYYKNGKIEEKYYIKNGLLEGRAYKYSDKGIILEMNNYCQNKLYGICESYTNYGGLLRRFLYIDDIQKVYIQMYKHKIVKDILLYTIFNIRNEEAILNGEILLKNYRIIPDSSYYYSTQIEDTIINGENAKLKIKAYNKMISNCSMEVYIGDLDKNLNFKDTSNVIHLISNTLEDSCYIKKYQLGYNLLLGKIIIYKNIIKHNKIIKSKLNEFVLFKEFFVSPPR